MIKKNNNTSQNLLTQNLTGNHESGEGDRGNIKQSLTTHDDPYFYPEYSNVTKDLLIAVKTKTLKISYNSSPSYQKLFL